MNENRMNYSWWEWTKAQEWNLKANISCNKYNECKREYCTSMDERNVPCGGIWLGKTIANACRLNRMGDVIERV